MLYQRYSASEYGKEDIDLTREYLRRYSQVFSYIFHEYGELAYKIDSDIMQLLADMRDFWYTSELRSSNPSIREIQDNVASNVTGILGIYEIHMYDLVSNWKLLLSSET